jgi:endonuclease-3
MDRKTFDEALAILRDEYPKWEAPAKKSDYGYRRTPYTITISVTLSFRTKDEMTQAAGERLFALADTPEKMVTLSKETIEKAIYPVGFYRKIAQAILDISRYLLKQCGGEVPDTEEELLKIIILYQILQILKKKDKLQFLQHHFIPSGVTTRLILLIPPV